MTLQAFTWDLTGQAQGDDNNTVYELAVRFELLTGNTLSCVGVRYHLPAVLSDAAAITAKLYDQPSHTLLASNTTPATPTVGGGDFDILFDTPVTLSDGNTTDYVASVLVGGSGHTRYGYVADYPRPVSQDPLFTNAFRLNVGAGYPGTGTGLNFLVSPLLSIGSTVVDGVAAVSPGALAVAAAGHRTVHGVAAVSLGAVDFSAHVVALPGRGAPIVSSTPPGRITSQTIGGRL